MTRIRSHRDLEVYAAAFGAAMRIFERRYQAAFNSKLSDAETEAAETQVWLEFAVSSGYLERSVGLELYRTYDQIVGRIVVMVRQPARWIAR